MQNELCSEIQGGGQEMVMILAKVSTITIRILCWFLVTFGKAEQIYLNWFTCYFLVAILNF